MVEQSIMMVKDLNYTTPLSQITEIQKVLMVVMEELSTGKVEV